MHNFDHRRCPACGELKIDARRRFVGGWFFIRCPNCRRQLRVDPQHGQRWILLVALALIGVAAIAGAAATDHTVTFVAVGALACALVYVWEFVLTRRSPLEPVTEEEAQGYRRNWAMTAIATLFATGAVVYAAIQV
jgi:drug/metabolite transporter (DMT)-like permease